MFSANSDFQKRGKKIHYNVDPAQKCSVTSSDYLMNVQISELLVFRIEVVFWRTFSVSSLLYIVESVTGERKKCFQPPTLLHNQFSNGETRASQVLPFLLVPPIILLPSRTIVNCCPIVKKTNLCANSGSKSPLKCSTKSQFFSVGTSNWFNQFPATVK